MAYAGCGRCHACGWTLSTDEWCEPCRAFRRYHEHGWGSPAGSPGGRCRGAADTISHIFRFPGQPPLAALAGGRRMPDGAF